METDRNHPVIRASQLRKTYPPLPSGPALVGLAQTSLDIWPAETIAVLGAPGSGKTTLLRLLAGLEQPTAGQILYGGDRLAPGSASAVYYASLASHALGDLPALSANAQLLLLDDLPAGALPDLAALRPDLPTTLAYATARVEDALPGSALNANGLATRVLVLGEGRVVFDTPSAMMSEDMPCYCIQVRDRLDPNRAAWFDSLAVLPRDGATILAGPIPDQPALFGLLARIRDLGLPLEALNLIPGGPPALLQLLVQ